MPLFVAPGAEALLLLLALPPLLWAALSDLRIMEIPDEVHFALLALFALWAVLFATPEAAMWRVVQGLVVLAVGLGLHFLGQYGGGDMKMAAAAAPLIAPWDRGATLMLLSLALLALFGALKLARRRAARRGAQRDWVSLRAETRDYPFGVAIAFAVGATLVLRALLTA